MTTGANKLCNYMYDVKDTHTHTHTHTHTRSKQDPDRCTPWRASDLVLSYKKDEVEYELYNEWQFLYPHNTISYDNPKLLQAHEISWEKICAI